MRLIVTSQRGFHGLNQGGGDMEEPRGLILFSKTPLGKEHFKSVLREKLILSLTISVILAFVCYFVIDFTLVMMIVILTFLILFRNLRIITSVPLAVNLNHPFMEQDAVSNSEIMVNFSGNWVHPGESRLKLVKEDVRGWVVYKSDEDFTLLSVWETKLKESVLTKQLNIINQAISLNNAINEAHDEFEDARDREEQESTLLEREWLPEEELDVQGPISRIFSSE